MHLHTTLGPLILSAGLRTARVSARDDAFSPKLISLLGLCASLDQQQQRRHGPAKQTLRRL